MAGGMFDDYRLLSLYGELCGLKMVERQCVIFVFGG